MFPNLPDCNLGIFCSFFLDLPKVVFQDKSIIKHQSSLVIRIWYLFFLALQSSLVCMRKKVSQWLCSMCSCILVLPLWSPQLLGRKGGWEEFNSKHMLLGFLSECFRLYQKAQSKLHKPEEKPSLHIHGAKVYIPNICY